MKKGTWSVVAAVVLGIACGGCGGSETPTGDSGPGNITINASAISNQSGKFLIVVATAEAGGPPLGRVCIPITSNSFTVPGVRMVEVAASGNPCDAANVTKVFPVGRYALTAGVFLSASQSAQKSTTVSVEVAGNVNAQINGAALSP
jgi:F0F1-type ATP synthase membrane subunit c/vacuolar-type H+-ATPase subunit K